MKKNKNKLWTEINKTREKVEKNFFPLKGRIKITVRIIINRVVKQYCIGRLQEKCPSSDFKPLHLSQNGIFNSQNIKPLTTIEAMATAPVSAQLILERKTEWRIYARLHFHLGLQENNKIRFCSMIRPQNFQQTTQIIHKKNFKTNLRRTKNKF